MQSYRCHTLLFHFVVILTFSFAADTTTVASATSLNCQSLAFVRYPNRTPPPPRSPRKSFSKDVTPLLVQRKNLLNLALDDNTLTRVADDDGTPIPFLDVDGKSFIECYADSVATVNGIEYTIGVPCDYSVALCYMENGELIPIELSDTLMDDVFNVAENIVREEFGEDLALQRTPQTLTLVGELDEEEEDDEDEEDEVEDSDELYDGEEEVELLLSFIHRGKEFSLVRLMDPILLVGKADPNRSDLRVLLTAEESEQVMPVLEEMFLEFHERDGMLP